MDDSHLNLPKRIHLEPLPEIKIGDTIFKFHDFEKTNTKQEYFYYIVSQSLIYR
jgi:hypothetical protein